MTFNRKQLYLFISAITLIKIGLLLVFNPRMEYFEDHDMAVNLHRTGEMYIDWCGLKNHTFQFPVYPFLLSILYSFFGIKPLAVGIFHVILNGISAFLLRDILGFFWNQFKLPFSFEPYRRKVLFIAVILFCLHPAITYYAIFKVHPFSLDLFMLLLPLFLTKNYFSNPKKINLLLLFIGAGLTALTRVTLLVSVLPFLVILLRYRGLAKTLLACSGLIIITALICTPWLIRNYKQDHIIGLSSLTGISLWKGSLPNSEGSNYLQNGAYCYSSLSHADTLTLIKLDVKGQDDFFRNRYSENIRAHPLEQVKLYFLKLKNFWIFRSGLGSEYSHQMERFIPFYLGGFLFMLLFSIYGAFCVGKKSLIMMVIPIFLSMEQALFYVETRHRLIIEPLLIFMALIGFLYLYTRLKRKE